VRRALVALAAIALLGTGVVLLTTSVPVLTVSGGKNGFIAYTPDGDKVVYSYRQSIYQVTVWEEFERTGDRLRLMRVRAEDIRAIEYFRWDSPIRQESTYFVADAPSTEVKELVIRISLGAEQRMRASGWSIFLDERFGDTVITVRLERPPMLVALARGMTW
jgi:hypothetical protein